MGFIHSVFGLAINLITIIFVTIASGFLARYLSQKFNLVNYLIVIYIVSWCLIMGLILYLIEKIRSEIASWGRKKKFQALKEVIQKEKNNRAY